MKYSAIIVLFCVVTLPLSAAVVSWSGNGDGSSFNDPANWNPRAIPTQDDDVTIGSAANRIVRVTTGSFTVRSLKNDATLTLEGGSLRFLKTSQSSGRVNLSGGILDTVEDF